MSASGVIEGERIIYLCIGASIVVHALAMLYAPKTELPPPPAQRIRATLRAAPAAPPPVTAPQPPRPEPVVEKPPVAPPPPPVPVAKSMPKPLPDKAPTKTAAPAAVPVPVQPSPAAPPPAQPAVTPPPVAAPPAAATPGPEAPKAAAPSSSNDVSDKNLIDGYQNQLATVAAKYKRYPNEAMQNSWEGTATIRLKIGSDGKIAAVEVANSSGHAMLDEQASITINKAKPFVQIPAGLRGKEFIASIRIVFSLKN